jgi:hypothetical protein
MENLPGLFPRLYRWRFRLAAVLGCLLISWFYFAQTVIEEKSIGRQALSHDAGALRLGPGAWSRAEDPARAKGGLDVEFSADIVKTEDGKLLIDKALLNTIQLSLLNGVEGDRRAHENQLLTDLKSKLPPSAFLEAQKLVQNYLAYMDAHDGLLERQNLVIPVVGSMPSGPYIDRLSTWNEQRSRLRQTIFGISIAQIWFGDDERQAQQTLARLRTRLSVERPDTNMADLSEQPDANAKREMRVHGVGLAAQLERDSQEWINQLTKSFSAIEHEEKDWKIHYSNYLRALGRLGNIDAVERNNKMQILREQYFSNEAERERARALGT